MLGPCDGDVKEPPLFLDALWGVGGEGVREKPLFEADNEDIFELKAFGSVDGHEGDSGRLEVVGGVEVGEKGDVGEVVCEKDLVGVGVARSADELLNG